MSAIQPERRRLRIVHLDQSTPLWFIDVRLVCREPTQYPAAVSAHAPPPDAAAVVEAIVAHRAGASTSPVPPAWADRRHCARHLKLVVLGLGGKAPLVVLDHANLDAAVNAAAFGATVARCNALIDDALAAVRCCGRPPRKRAPRTSSGPRRPTARRPPSSSG
jgi:hypothetical protein